MTNKRIDLPLGFEIKEAHEPSVVKINDLNFMVIFLKKINILKFVLLVVKTNGIDKQSQEGDPFPLNLIID